MNDSRDRVDKMFEALRADTGSAPPINHELEQRLMDRFSQSQPPSRFSRSSVLVVGLGIFLIGGAALAATGGVTRIANWILNVEINGESMEVALDENGESTFTVDTENGPATVHIQRTESDEDGTMTEIRVVQGEGDALTEEVGKVVRRRMMIGTPVDYTVEDLGDAEAFDEWVDEFGVTNALYVLPTANGKGSDVFLLTQAKGQDANVRLAARTPMSLISDEFDTDISVADDGTVTIRLEYENGQVQEMKMRLVTGADDLDDAMQRRLKIATQGGKLTISVESSKDDQ